MKLNSGDYFILDRGKPTLCIKLEGGYRGVIESTMSSDESETVTYEPEQVLANLGQNPRTGSYLGVKVRPFVKKIWREDFGTIYVHTDVPKKELKAFGASMRKVYDWYAEKASVAFLPLDQFIYPKSGKYAGTYSLKTTRSGERQDSIQYYYTNFADRQYNEYVIAHEFAHGLMGRCLDPRMRAEWTSLYQSRLRSNRCKQDKLQALWDDVQNIEDSIFEYQKQLDDENDAALLKEVFQYFRNKRKMTVRDIQLLLELDTKALQAMWPRSAILIQENPDVTEYAMKNVDEFFAESIAYHYMGKTLPKDVRACIKKSLTPSNLS